MGLKVNVTITILVIILAMLFQPLMIIINKGNLFTTYNPTNSTCTTLKGIPLSISILYVGPKGCEDVYVNHAEGLAFFACTDKPELRKSWFGFIFNPFDDADIIRSEKDKAYLLNLQDDVLVELSIEGFPNEINLAFHGLGGITDESEPSIINLMFINHRHKGKNSIELFEFRIGTKSIKHIKSFEDDLISTPNDVIPLSKDSFLFTNDHKHTNGFLKPFEGLGIISGGSVIYYKDNKYKVVAEGLAYPNGITSNKDRTMVYVTQTLKGNILVYDWDAESVSLRYLETIELDFTPDNINIEPETGHIYVAGMPKILTAQLYTLGFTNEKAKYITPSVVVRISEEISDKKFYGNKYKIDNGFEDDGSQMSFATAGAGDSKFSKVLVSSIFSSNILVCALPN